MKIARIGKLSRFLGSTTLLSISTLLRTLSILAVTVALGRSEYGGPSAVGQLSILLAFAAIAQSAAIGGISGAALHKLVTATPLKWLETVKVISAARIILLPICFSLAFLAYLLLARDSNLTLLAIAFFFSGYAIGTYDVGELIHISGARYWGLAYRRSVVVLTVSIPKIYFASLGNLDAVLILQGLEMCLCALVMLMSRDVPVIAMAPTSASLRGGVRELARVRLLWLSSIVSVLAMRIDVLLVAAILGNDAAGQYSTASRFVEAASIVAASVGTLALRDLSSNSGSYREYGASIRRNSKLTSTIGVLASVGSAAVSPILILLLYGPEFKIASVLSIAYSVTLMVIFYRQLVSKLMVVESAFRLSLSSNLLSVGLAVASGFVLIPRFDLWGAVIATLLSYYGSVALGLSATWAGRSMLISTTLGMINRETTDRCAARLIESR